MDAQYFPWHLNHSLSVSQGLNKGHKRAGSAPPSMPLITSKQRSHSDLQGIPEEPDAHGIAETCSNTPTARFTGKGSTLVGEAPLLTTVLESPESSLIFKGSAIQTSMPHHVPPLNFHMNGNQAPVTAEKLELGVSQSPNNDAVDFPPTPERPQHSSTVLLGTESYCSPSERAIPSRDTI